MYTITYGDQPKKIVCSTPLKDETAAALMGVILSFYALL
jgi:hypothetical protein